MQIDDDERGVWVKGGERQWTPFSLIEVRELRRTKKRSAGHCAATWSLRPNHPESRQDEGDDNCLVND